MGPAVVSSPSKSKHVTSPEARQDTVEKTVLPNGLRVITEQMPHVRSVAMGVWVDTGSRHESDDQSGISHFIEHMVFKGTTTRSAEDIACSVDAIGGHLDAFTTKENVAFTAKVLDQHVPRALDVVSDMVLDPAFRENDISKEKSVVLEELKMDEDNPDYLIHEIFTKNFWKGHALGRPIIGNRKTITAFESKQVRGYFHRTYVPSNLIITAAGNLRHDDFVKLVEERFSGLGSRPCEKPADAPNAAPSIVLHDKPSLEQVHVCLGVPTHRMADPRRYASFVLNTVLGGGVSSRLFLKIREREGLAYAVFSDFSLYADAGCLTVYAGTSLDTTASVLEHVLEEFRDLKENLVPEEELRRAKDHLKGSLMLSLESTSSRMSNLARQEKYLGRFLTLDEVSEQIEAVEAESLRELANEWFRQEKIALAILGNLGDFQMGREKLAC
jgi:predicted Zn-dependent peptidase